MQVPRVVKVIVSMGVGEAKENKKLLDAAVTDLGIITGQHAVKTKARKSIATFKIRQGQEIGARVTLALTDGATRTGELAAGGGWTADLAALDAPVREVSIQDVGGTDTCVEVGVEAAVHRQVDAVDVTGQGVA